MDLMEYLSIRSMALKATRVSVTNHNLILGYKACDQRSVVIFVNNCDIVSKF